ncbi:MAG: hypothetical protein U9Q16_02750, partial [Patescibacteria group bacterium]|nr:hypothetical protein [Patescibacteria group bacterium]
MKNSKRFFMVAAFLTACFVFTGLNAPTVKAVTLDELQAQIDALMAQITNLQQEKAQLQTGNGSDGTGETWCHTFNVRLKYGDTGSEVHALRTALRKEGFDVPPVFSNYITTKFEKYTSAAVVGFQEKYRADILAPYNISHGTGYVGPTTLAKLNELYRCSTKKGTISITPVNVFQGKTYSFSGKVMGAEPNSMVHFYLKSSKGNMLENGKYVGTTNSSGYFSTNRNQKIYSLAPIGIYDAWVVINGQKSNIVTLTVSASTDCHTTAPWSWEYCTPECPCDAGEGDCDSDADCTTGYCHNNVGA